MDKKVFEIEMKVRDYECDAQGIVNNANYMHYYEVARHEFLESRNISFSDSHDQGIDMVVSKVEINYKSPLKGGDRFLSSLTIEKSGVRMVFHQTLKRKKDNVLCNLAITEVVILINGSLSLGDYFDEKLADYLAG